MRAKAFGRGMPTPSSPRSAYDDQTTFFMLLPSFASAVPNRLPLNR